MRIVCERELVAAGAGGVGRGERHAVGTTPDQPRGEFLRVLRRRRGAGDGRDEISEFRHVLFQLTKDQVRAVAAKLTKVGSPAGTYCRQQGVAVEPRVDRNSWIDRSIAGRVAQEELARLDQMLRAPLGDPIDRAVRAFDFRLRDPVSEPEMLAVKRPACGGLLLGIGHEFADQIGVEASCRGPGVHQGCQPFVDDSLHFRLGVGVDHDEEIDAFALRTTPVPTGRIVPTDVAKRA